MGLPLKVASHFGTEPENLLEEGTNRLHQSQCLNWTNSIVPEWMKGKANLSEI